MSAQLDVLEPATGELLQRVPRVGPDAVDLAVERAHAVLPQWRALAPQERAARMRALADAVEADHERLAVLEARNAGKPIGNARGEIQMVADTIRYYAAMPERLLGDTIPVAGGIGMTFRESLGVVGLITPWNFPMAIAAWKLGPALAGGNCVILKPAELTPLTSMELPRLAREAGFPEHVIQVLVGPGSTVGAAMATHPRIAKIAFTGSTAVGAGIQAAAAATIKRVTLELGGKSANVIFADADLELAAAQAPMAVFDNSGQDCCARSRILVQRPVYERFLSLLEPHVKTLTVGQPLDAATDMGPLISAAHRDEVRSFLPADHAKIAFQGSAPDGPGFWEPPTVLYDLDAGDRAITDEIFGPIAAVIPFDDEADAIRLANDTIYGLSGSIWTVDGAKALRVARAIETGVLSINSNSSVRVSTPFGGMKQSGIGRELGPHAVDAYTEIKTVYYRTEN